MSDFALISELSDEQWGRLEVAAIERGLLEWAVAQSQVRRYYDATQLKELVVAILEKVTTREAEREPFRLERNCRQGVGRGSERRSFKTDSCGLVKA